jgi:hypothetical protein
MTAATYITFRYGGGGKSTHDTLDAAVAAAKQWAVEQDAGAAVYDADARMVFSQIGSTEQAPDSTDRASSRARAHRRNLHRGGRR